MVRKFTTPVELPADPTAALQAATKSYVDGADAAANYSRFGPVDHGLLAWTYDALDAATTYQPTGNGFFFSCAIKVDTAITCTNVTYMVSTAGAAFTTNRNYIGIYSTAGTLLRQTSDMATVWTTAGVYTHAWSAGSISLAAGTYLLAGITTATTRPTFAAKAVMNGANNPAALGRGAGTYRTYANTSTAQTAMPAAPPAASTFINAVWFGLS